MRNGIQTISTWIGLNRPITGERGSDLLTADTDDEVEFTILSPVSGTPDVLLSFTLLTETWLRRHCDSFTYDRANVLTSKTNVVLVSSSKDSLIAAVRNESGDTCNVSANITVDGLTTTCSCDEFKRAIENSSDNLRERLACEHITALLKHCLDRNVFNSPASTENVSVCPITRHPLDVHHLFYRCERCSLSFSVEGWDFIKRLDRGRCCGCHTRGTIRPVPTGSEG